MAGRGARGAGGGAGAGGRRGRGTRKKRPGDADFYADDDVWTDGEEASPPVLR
jgi:hypothetical protein